MEAWSRFARKAASLLLFFSLLPVQFFSFLQAVMAGGKKKGRGRTKKKPPPEQLLASSYIHKWAFREDRDSPQRASDVGGFLPPPQLNRSTGDRVVFELHCHSKCSDGFLSPSAVVARAHGNGVSAFSFTYFSLRSDSRA